MSGATRTTKVKRFQSPYARPAVKKSSWSITGFLNYLNPLRPRSPSESSESLSSYGEDIDEESFEPRASTRMDISPQASRNLPAGPSSRPEPTLPPPRTPSKLAPITPIRPQQLEESSSPAKNLEAVSVFLAERAGHTITNLEVEGLISLINKSTPPDRHEPFRFTSSTPSTPARGNSPLFANTQGMDFSFGSPTAQTTTTPSPRKTLSKNPNGKYRWEGGGSSKLPRSRNRYSSPAFGPSRSSNDRILLKDTQPTSEVPKDTKRRRVGDDAAKSSAAPSGPPSNGARDDPPSPSQRSSAPDPSPTRVSQALPFPVSNGPPTPTRTLNGTTAKVNSSSSSSRLRLPQLSAKPTVPVVPSPLRQAWSGGSSSSTSDSPPTLQKQTKAANFMEELLKEVTPPKRPDLSNPYQTASPVSKVGPPKPRAKRVRATGKPAPPTIKEDTLKEKEKEPEKKDEKEYSPQAIIEATLPKGSKRSRPPAHLQKQPTSAILSPQPAQTTRSDVSVEADDDEEEQKRTTKRPKPHLNGRGLASSTARKPVIPIEEIDVDMETAAGKASESTAPSISAPTTASAPTISNSTSSPATGKHLFAPFKSTSAPKEPSKLRYSYQPEASSQSTPPTPPSTLSFASATKSNSSLTNDTPVIDVFATQHSPSTPVPSSTASTLKTPSPISPKTAALSTPVGSLNTFVFSVRPFVHSNIDALKEVQTLPKSSLPVFDLTKPSSTKPTPPPVKAFDWGAAGVKPTASGAGASWTCSVCMLSNPATATTQCTICDTPR